MSEKPFSGPPPSDTRKDEGVIRTELHHGDIVALTRIHESVIPQEALEVIAGVDVPSHFHISARIQFDGREDVELGVLVDQSKLYGPDKSAERPTSQIVAITHWHGKNSRIEGVFPPDESGEVAIGRDEIEKLGPAYADPDQRISPRHVTLFVDPETGVPYLHVTSTNGTSVVTHGSPTTVENMPSSSTENQAAVERKLTVIEETIARNTQLLESLLTREPRPSPDMYLGLLAGQHEGVRSASGSLFTNELLITSVGAELHPDFSDKFPGQRALTSVGGIRKYFDDAREAGELEGVKLPEFAKNGAIKLHSLDQIAGYLAARGGSGTVPSVETFDTRHDHDLGKVREQIQRIIDRLNAADGDDEMGRKIIIADTHRSLGSLPPVILESSIAVLAHMVGEGVSPIPDLPYVQSR